MKTSHTFYFLFGIILFVSYSCQKETNNAQNPSLKVVSVTSTSATTAIAEFEITSNGGADILELGYCISNSPNPDILSFKTPAFTYSGKFRLAITGLAGNTMYYLKGFAKNNSGTGYTEVVSFQTPELETVKDIDGNVYGVINIGNQIWMAENLRTTKYRNGDPVTFVDAHSIPSFGKAWSSQTSGAWSLSWGKMKYNWYVGVDPRNIAPVGWHVPSNTEMQSLLSSLPHTTNFNYGFGRIDGITGSTAYSSALGDIFAGLWTTSGYADGRATFLSYWPLDKDNYEGSVTETLKTTGLDIRCVKDK